MRNFFPQFPRRKVTELDGLWDFVFLGGAALAALHVKELIYLDRLPVPSAFDAYPRYAGKRGVAVYRTTFAMPPGSSGEIEFEAAGPFCQIYLDGEPVMSHQPNYTRFVVPLAASGQGEHELAVAVDNRFDRQQSPLVDPSFDFYNYGGIIRSVRVHELPPSAITSCRVTPLDLAGNIEVAVKSAGPERPMTAMIDGIGLGEVAGPCFRLKVPQPALWSHRSPNLHLLTLDNGNDAIVVRFGIRTVAAADGKILLNGGEVKLLGVCRHEAHAQFGPALPYQQLVQDIELIRDSGCNFVRGAHYPQDPRFLDLCDENGILVFEENLGWGQSADYLADPEFIRLQVASTLEMIEASYNHPCVIMHGFLNEGESSREEGRRCYQLLIDTVRKHDPSRLVVYASNKYQKDLFLSGTDVVCFNLYPGWYDAFDKEELHDEILPRIASELAFVQSHPELRGKPFLISEIGAAALYGWRDPLHGPWTEEFQAEYLRIVCQEVVDNDAIAGVAIWQFCDCRTYNCGRALGRARAFNNKGILDEYRRPKQSYGVVKAVFDANK